MTDQVAVAPGQQLYANLMDEARMRVHAVRDVIDNKENWVPRFLQEFCYLQYRMLCEQVAVGCLIAHGDITNSKALGSWSLTEVMRKLEEVNPDFYPQPVKITPTENGVQLSPIEEVFMTKSELMKFWETSGNYLHRGSAKSVFREAPEGPVVDVDELINIGLKFKNLLQLHYIRSADAKKSLLVELLGPDGHSRVSVCAAT